MTEYQFPGWRKIIFVAVLIVIIVISLAPAISQGTVNVRVYGPPSDGLVSHVFVKFSQVELHNAGFPTDSGWVTFTQVIPKVDLVSSPGQFVPQVLLTSRIQSGRYDTIKLTVANATIVVNSITSAPVSTGLVLNTDLTIPVPPNGSGDVLVVLTLDYRQLLDTPPALAVQILQATAA